MADTTVECGSCDKVHQGGSRKCDCGYPLPPPCRVLSGYLGVLLNKHEQDRYRGLPETPIKLSLWKRIIGE